MRSIASRELRLFLGVRVAKANRQDYTGTIVDLKGYATNNHYCINDECIFGVEWDDGTYNDISPFCELVILNEDPWKVYTIRGSHENIATPNSTRLLRYALNQNPLFKLRNDANPNTLSHAKRVFTELSQEIESGDLTNIDIYNSTIDYDLPSRNYVDKLAEGLTEQHMPSPYDEE